MIRSGPKPPMLFLAALLAGALPATAQTPVDQGTFTIMLDGRRAGEETFSIAQAGAGSNASITATGRVEVEGRTGTMVLRPRLSVRGVEASPVSYQVDVRGGEYRRLVGTAGPNRFSQRIATDAGEQLREFVASSSAVILDDLVAHHYYFLANRVRNGEAAVIIPGESRQVMVRVSDRGEQPVRIGDRTVNLFHLVVQPQGGGIRNVWVDALNRVIRVEIPDRGYVAERTEIPR